MATELSKFTAGEPRTLIEAAEANKLVDSLNAWMRVKISPQGCGSFKISDENVVLDLNPLLERLSKLKSELKQLIEEGGGGITSIEHPFQIYKIDDTHVKVRYGTLQDIVPTGIDTSTVVGSGVAIFYLNMEVDLGGAIVAVSVGNAASLPVDADYHGYIALGAVTLAAGVQTISQAVTHSLRYAICGRTVDGESLVSAGFYEFWGV